MNEFMTSPAHDATPATAEGRLRAEVERLGNENRLLHQEPTSHAVVDQAIGVLAAPGQIAPQDGFSVLREVYQHTNTRLTAIADQILKNAQGPTLPEVQRLHLRAALARHVGPRSGGPRSESGQTCSLKFPNPRATARGQASWRCPTVAAPPPQWTAQRPGHDFATVLAHELHRMIEALVRGPMQAQRLRHTSGSKNSCERGRALRESRTCRAAPPKNSLPTFKD
ncbi:ANTAR domain-containing protein [Streptomyces echinatus]|nr:ANTAR domain-containing protein [Streptomyces echinatus]